MKVSRMRIGRATKIFGLLFVSAITLAAAAPAAASILVNGGFEQPGPGPAYYRLKLDVASLPGWTYLTGPGQSGSYEEYDTNNTFGITAADGTQYVSFGGNGTYGGMLSQTFATVAGATYTVAYSTGEQQGDDSAQILRAIVRNGIQTLTADNIHLSLGFTSGAPITFNATGSSATLSFLDATPAGFGGGSNLILDAVSVSGPAVGGGVPEPSSWALMIVGFGLVGSAVRSRRASVMITAS